MNFDKGIGYLHEIGEIQNDIFFYAGDLVKPLSKHDIEDGMRMSFVMGVVESGDHKGKPIAKLLRRHIPTALPLRDSVPYPPPPPPPWNPVPKLPMPLRSISKKNGPAPPKHPPPAALLPVPSPGSSAALSKHPPLAGVLRSPAPPNHPPPVELLPRSASSKSEDVGELVQGVCGGMYVWDAEKKELQDYNSADSKRARITKM